MFALSSALAGHAQCSKSSSVFPALHRSVPFPNPEGIASFSPRLTALRATLSSDSEIQANSERVAGNPFRIGERARPDAHLKADALPRSRAQPPVAASRQSRHLSSAPPPRGRPEIAARSLPVRVWAGLGGFLRQNPHKSLEKGPLWRLRDQSLQPHSRVSLMSDSILQVRKSVLLVQDQVWQARDWFLQMQN